MKKTDSEHYKQQCQFTGILKHCWWECEQGFTLWKTGSFSKVEQCYHAADFNFADLAISTLGI